MSGDESVSKVIAGCQAGEPEAFSRLVDLYATRCYNYFYRLTGDKNTSDELLSKLYVRLVEKIASYKGGIFEKWLFRIASNIFYDHLRSQQRQEKLLRQKRQELMFQSYQQESLQFDIIDKLQAQLAKLDADTREAIVLRFYSQLGFREIADIKQQPIGTVLAKVHRGLKKLRGLMEER
jgi:RNA polymerase sigma-70 factor (ECF subfamily)